MSKWESIAIAIMLAIMFGSLAIKQVCKSNASVEKAKMGLEECPIELGGTRTIWVKDCITYTKALK